MTAVPPTVLGIFVGGASRRMRGAPKALLLAPGSDETLVARLVRVGREAGLQVVIVGEGDVGGELGAITRLRDLPAGVGPLGGLGALLQHAEQHACAAISVACDMPFVSAGLLRRLACDPHACAVLAPRDLASGKWQALFARYDPARVRPALSAALSASERSFQALFARVACDELVLSSDEQQQLRDWDTPEDMTKECT